MRLATIAIGSSVSPHDRIAKMSSRGRTRRAFKLRHDQCRVRIARHNEHRESFERHRLVTSEPRKVGPNGEQAHVDTLLSHRRSDSVDALTKHEVIVSAWITEITRWRKAVFKR